MKSQEEKVRLETSSKGVKQNSERRLHWHVEKPRPSIDA